MSSLNHRLLSLFKTTAVLAMGFSYAGSSQAQTLFQNTNQNCGADVVLCDSFVSGPFFCEHDAVSIACRNISQIADFNGDTFPDCVASTYGTANDSAGLTMSVLMNVGSAAACPGNQFNPARDYVFSGLTDSALVIDVGTVLVGQLDGTGNTDIVGSEVSFAPSPKHLSTVFNFDPATPDETSLPTTDVDWEPAGTSQDGFNFDLFDSDASERGLALFDCDNNGTLDAVIGVLEAEPSSAPLPFDFRINILKNSGSGLEDVNLTGASIDTGVAFNDSPTQASVTVEDFNNDDFLDVVMANQSFATPGSQVSVCLNDRNCGFSCSQQINLEDAHPNDSDPWPSSIAAGDFDGDTNADIVVTETQLNSNLGIHYYFGNGDGTFQPSGTHVTLDQPDQRLPKVLTTGCFNNDNVVDVAVSCDGSNVASFNDASVQVITSNASGGFNAQLPLTITETNGAFDMAGVDSADFDKQGGDDLIALGRGDQNGREAFAFMNSVEILSAIAGADQVAQLNTPPGIAGASCTVNPEITGDPARFAIQWTITGSPAGSAPTLNGATTLTPTFQSATPGAYTLQLSCLTGCTRTVLDSKTVTIAQVIPTPVPTPTPLADTQGGCLADLTPTRGEKVGWGYIPWLALPALFLLRRKGLAGR